MASGRDASASTPKHSNKWPRAKDSRSLTPVCTPENNTAAMWQDARVDFRQSISIGIHCNDYFRRRLFARVSDVCCLYGGHMEPAVKAYKTEAK